MCETNRLFNRARPKTDSVPSHPNRTHSCNRASSVASSATRIQSPHKYVDTHRVTEAACFPTLAHGFDELDDWGKCQLQRRQVKLTRGRENGPPADRFASACHLSQAVPSLPANVGKHRSNGVVPRSDLQPRRRLCRTATGRRAKQGHALFWRAFLPV